MRSVALIYSREVSFSSLACWLANAIPSANIVVESCDISAAIEGQKSGTVNRIIAEPKSGYVEFLLRPTMQNEYEDNELLSVTSTTSAVEFVAVSYTDRQLLRRMLEALNKHGQFWIDDEQGPVRTLAEFLVESE